MKKYVLIVCFVLLLLYTVHKILEYKGVQISNNSVYVLFYLFLLVTVLVVPAAAP